MFICVYVNVFNELVVVLLNFLLFELKIRKCFWGIVFFKIVFWVVVGSGWVDFFYD